MQDNCKKIIEKIGKQKEKEKAVKETEAKCKKKAMNIQKNI